MFSYKNLQKLKFVFTFLLFKIYFIGPLVLLHFYAIIFSIWLATRDFDGQQAGFIYVTNENVFVIFYMRRNERVNEGIRYGCLLQSTAIIHAKMLWDVYVNVSYKSRRWDGNRCWRK